MQNKWTLNEEKQLVFKLRDGAQMKNIAESSGRSYGAIKERLKKIIYENIKNIDNNHEVQKVSKYLNLDPTLIKKYYKAYGDRIKQNQEETKQIESKQIEPKQVESKQIEPKQEQLGGMSVNMTIRKQNELLEDIIKNHDLKKKIGKLIKKKQLDKFSKEILKKYINIFIL